METRESIVYLLFLTVHFPGKEMKVQSGTQLIFQAGDTDKRHMTNNRPSNIFSKSCTANLFLSKLKNCCFSKTVFVYTMLQIF